MKLMRNMILFEVKTTLDSFILLIILYILYLFSVLLVD